MMHKLCVWLLSNPIDVGFDLAPLSIAGSTEKSVFTWPGPEGVRLKSLSQSGYLYLCMYVCMFVFKV